MTMSFDILNDLNLARIPTPRMEVPTPRDTADASATVNFKKALRCVDPILTARFSNYVPGKIVIDQSIDTRNFKPGWSFAICIPTDVPPPSTPAVLASTGISSEMTLENFLIELAIWLERAYLEYGARKMSPPLIFQTGGGKLPGGTPTRPLLGAIVTFDRTPPDGQTVEDMMNDVGMVAPKEDIKGSGLAGIIATPGLPRKKS